MNKNAPLILVLTAVIIILAGVIYWQQGNQDCQKRLGPIMETRFIPLSGCQVKIADQWRSESEIKNSLNEGAREIQEGTKKVMHGLFGDGNGK